MITNAITPPLLISLLSSTSAMHHESVYKQTHIYISMHKNVNHCCLTQAAFTHTINLIADITLCNICTLMHMHELQM